MMQLVGGAGEWRGPLPTPESARQFLERVKRHHKLVPLWYLIFPVAIGFLIALFF